MANMNDMTDCIFCKIISGQIPCHKVYETDNAIALLDISPSSKGHALVVPKAHAKDLLDMAPEQISAVFQAAQKVGKAVMKSTGSHGFNIVMNNGSAAGQIVFHAHVHVIPRTERDGVVPPFRHTKYEEGEAAEIASKIKSCTN